MMLSDPPPATASLTAELARIFGRIGRGLRYRTRAARETLDITHSEGELLRLVGRQPGIRVQDAALELGVASNSVSTLVKQLNRVGLLDRSNDPLDGRAVCLRLSPLAQEWLNQLGNAREQAIDRALAALDDEDRRVLEAAMPSLRRLAKAITDRGGTA